jgi:hypothetical protein
MPQVDKVRMFLNLFKEKSKVMDKVKQINEMSSKAKHTALGGVGMASQGPVGMGADLADAGLYAKEGDWGGAGLSLLSMIPGLGILSGIKKTERLSGVARPKKQWKFGDKRLKEIEADDLRLSKKTSEADEVARTYEKVADPAGPTSFKDEMSLVDESVLNKFMKETGIEDPEEAFLALKEIMRGRSPFDF